MATKSAAKAKSTVDRSVTLDRARRLHLMLTLLAARPQMRESLIKRLRLDVRGFYRDLELLRESGIKVEMNARRYLLSQEFKSAIDMLPFPDPHLNLGEAKLLQKGSTKAHQKLRKQLQHISKA